MCILHSLTVFIVFTVALTETEVNEDKGTGPNEDDQRDIDKLVTMVPRRFIDDLTDEEWHVAHLKRPQENARKSGCKKSFEDQVKRYRKDMINEGDFVSADPLPFDVKDLADSCKIEDEFDQTASETKANSSLRQSMTQKLSTEDSDDIRVDIVRISHVVQPVKNKIVKEVQSQEPIQPVTENKTKDDPEIDNLEVVQLNVTINNETANNETESKMETGNIEKDDLRSGIEVEVESAEMVKTNEKNESLVQKTAGENIQNATETVQEGITTNKPKDDKDRNADVRRSEYQFGSVEYYDDKLEFDPNTCPPDTVDVITPELELLNDFDPECILNLEWRCLE